MTSAITQARLFSKHVVAALLAGNKHSPMVGWMVARCAAGRLGIQDLLGMGGVIVGTVVGSLFGSL